MKRVGIVLVVLGVVSVVGDTSLAQRRQPPSDTRRPGPPQSPAARFNPLLRLFDADNDGTLSEEEIAAAGAKLKQFDRSQDGKLTAEELREALPFGRRGGPPMGFGSPGMRPGAGPREATGPGGPPLPKDDVEKRILTALEQMRQGPRFANVSPTDGRLLRLLTEAIGAKRVVEIGTSTGHSAVWFALGLQKTGGHLYTHEIDQGRAEAAKENFKRAGVEDQITVILGDAHETVKQHKEPIDILFLDADKQGYIDYLDKLLPLVRPGGLIIAHNMRSPGPDPRYLEAITKNPDLETSFLLMEGAGVGVTLKKR